MEVGLRTITHPSSWGRHARTEYLNQTTHTLERRRRHGWTYFKPGRIRAQIGSGNIRLTRRSRPHRTSGCRTRASAATWGYVVPPPRACGGASSRTRWTSPCGIYPCPAEYQFFNRRPIGQPSGNAHLLESGVLEVKKVR